MVPKGFVLAAAGFVYLGAAVAAGQVPPQANTADTTTPAARAVTYLVAEVPRWRREHPCYSCHNNGDAVRVLVTAAGRGYDVGESIDDTLAWLATPDRWDSNARRGGSDELPLGRIQFASTLAQMVAWGRGSQDALNQAALLLIGHQDPDGSFTPNPLQTIGGATAYGRSLATSVAHRVLARSTAPEAKEPAARARAWLRTADSPTVLDCSSVILGLERDGDPPAMSKRQECLQLLKRSQGSDGGWGPYTTSQSEVFDTALALMAMVMVRNIPAIHAPAFDEPELERAIARARAFLLQSQNPDGSWTETTRPSNGESYAQRISTTAWSLQALLAAE